MEQQERIKFMAEIMMQARTKNQEDVGELVAAALSAAATQLGNVGFLISGRPGSWEADIVRRMAQAGGSGNPERVEALAALMVDMGNAGVDGGDELSQAMSLAVDELGGLRSFAGGSRWYEDLVNIGCQYSNYDYLSAF